MTQDPLPYATPVLPVPDQNARNMAVLCHLLSLVPVPGANVIAPLILWQVKRLEHPFIDDQGRESVNFQIFVLLLGLVLSPTIFCMGLGVVLIGVLWVVAIVLAIVAALEARKGVPYRYPFIVRLL